MPLKEITCSNCGTKVKKKVCESINLSEDSKCLKEIMEGNFNFSYCPKCKTKIEHKSHVLLSKVDPPRWIWLVSKKYQSPQYQSNFFSEVLPLNSTSIIDQEMVFVEFGEPCECLHYIIEGKQPQSSEDWLKLGKMYTGDKAIDCFKNALRLDNSIYEAKNLMHEEMDKLKSYSL
ncbi:MAG: CpXC domain-containing protein [Candidatus Heimdallarchaeaceae archaeon]